MRAVRAKLTTKPSRPARAGKTVVVIGAGNIGSQLIPNVARMSAVGRMTIIDPDAYEAKNLAGQNIVPSDVGKPKAAVQARRARRINPSLRVEAMVRRVEDVPLGKLRGDVLLACVDSKEPRQTINQIAWRLGIAWIDSGVSAVDGLFARVNVYVPSVDSPCLECGWDARDYESLGRSYPCAGGAPQAAATDAPPGLGQLAASLQAIECEKLLAGDTAHLAAGQEVLIDAKNHTHFVTRFGRNADCRFDHRTWSIRALDARPGVMTFGQAFDLAAAAGGANGAALVRVEGRPFVMKMQCTDCGASKAALRLKGRLRRTDEVCRQCGGRMAPVGSDMRQQLELTPCSPRRFRQTFGSVGFRSGDIFGIRGSRGREVFYEFSGE